MSRFHSQVREVINRNIFISLALEQGFNVFLPVYDDGVDFILHHEQRNDTRKVQLKGRWTIDRKYLGRDIWIAFPVGGDWYLIPHQEMVRSAEADGVTETKAWKDGGLYSRPKLSAATITSCARFRFPPSSDAMAEAADSASDDKFTWKKGDIEIVSPGIGRPLSDLD
jgi:hypothetical protein